MQIKHLEAKQADSPLCTPLLLDGLTTYPTEFHLLAHHSRQLHLRLENDRFLTERIQGQQAAATKQCSETEDWNCSSPPSTKHPHDCWHNGGTNGQQIYEEVAAPIPSYYASLRQLCNIPKGFGVIIYEIQFFHDSVFVISRIQGTVHGFQW